MDSQDIQYDSTIIHENFTHYTLEDSALTPSTSNTPAPAVPAVTPEYWVFDNGICG